MSPHNDDENENEWTTVTYKPYKPKESTLYQNWAPNPTDPPVDSTTAHPADTDPPKTILSKLSPQDSPRGDPLGQTQQDSKNASNKKALGQYLFFYALQYTL